jgi:hypothetical protein
MTYPQTSAETATLDGQEYWRLFTELESSGDIYELPVSARAIVVGSDSDIARVDLVYYDNQSDNLANQVVVSIDKPLVGRVDALFSTPYESGDRARILISSADLLPPANYTPQGFDAVNDILEIVQPRIDLHCYIDEQPGFIPPRSDRFHLFEALPFTGTFDESIWYVIPFYGRRFAECTFKSLGLVSQPAVTTTVWGANFSNIIADVAIADDGHQLEQLGQVIMAPPALGAGLTDSVTVLNRAWDALVVQVVPAAAFPSPDSFVTHIVVSDKV